MRRGRGQLLWPLLLLVACAVAGARLYEESSQEPDATAGEDSMDFAKGGTAPAVVGAKAALGLPPPQQFAVIAERPLFAQTRRPPPPASPAPEAKPAAEAAPTREPTIAAAPAPEPLPPLPTVDFALVGIVTSGGERYALVRRQVDGSVVEIPEGGDISGWFAVLIDPERAVFRQGSAITELMLKYDTPVPPDLIPPRTVVKPQPPVQPADRGAPAGNQQQQTE